MKFNEDKILEDFTLYINNTYTQHYANPSNNRQLMDDIVADGLEGLGFLRWGAKKYISRYGKKAGYNKIDLYKAMHLCMLMLHMEEQGQFNEKGN